MVSPTSDKTTAPRRWGSYRDDPDTLSVVTTPPEPSLAEWRARCLLALSLVNHRRTPDGLTDLDTTVIHGALMGEWDV